MRSETVYLTVFGTDAPVMTVCAPLGPIARRTSSEPGQIAGDAIIVDITAAPAFGATEMRRPAAGPGGRPS